MSGLFSRRNVLTRSILSLSSCTTDRYLRARWHSGWELGTVNGARSLVSICNLRPSEPEERIRESRRAGSTRRRRTNNLPAVTVACYMSTSIIIRVPTYRTHKQLRIHRREPPGIARDEPTVLLRVTDPSAVEIAFVHNAKHPFTVKSFLCVAVQIRFPTGSSDRRNSYCYQIVRIEMPARRSHV